MMREMYERLGISSQVYGFGQTIIKDLRERFDKIDETAEYNQMKVLAAMQKTGSARPAWEHPPATATTIWEGILWSRYMQIPFTRRRHWSVRRLPAEPMLWPLLCLET